MKKYILFIILSAFNLLQVKAANHMTDLPQDSIFGKEWNFDIDMDEIRNSMDKWNIQMNNIDSVKSRLRLSSDTTRWMAMQESIISHMNDLSKAIEDWDFNGKFEDLSKSFGKEIKEFSKKMKLNNFNFNVTDNNQDKKPTRIEKKTFQNISEVKFVHQYGDIIVKESDGKNIELEIHYFDVREQKASCVVNTANGFLTVNTSSVSGGKQRPKINYIINIPKNIALSIDLKYGNVKMDKLSGRFSADLSYTNLFIQELSGAKSSINAKYTDIKIDKAKDLYFSISYCSVYIKKSERLEITGNYNDYLLDDIYALTTTGRASSYGNMKIGNITDMNVDVKYLDMTIGNLVSTMNTTTAYGDINIKNVSPQLKNINIKANYTDVSVSLPTDASVKFDFNFNYGDLDLSKKYEVRYAESSERGSRVIKKGQIGKGNPTAIIQVTNNYADIKIK